MPYKNPNALADSFERKAKKGVDLNRYFDFDKDTDDELLKKFIKSSGWGFRGAVNKDGFTFSGPDWEDSYNPMSRQQVIDELRERKRIDDEDDGDWFAYLYED